MTDTFGVTLDRRRSAYRPDLAAAYLRGKVDAPRFEEGYAARVIRAQAPLCNAPDPAASLDTELLYGEVVQVFDEAGGWAWVQSHTDGYVGYAPRDVLSRDMLPATHRVQSLGTFVYPKPDIKSPPVLLLPMNAVLTVAAMEDKFAQLSTGAYVFARHLAPLDKFAKDFVDIAERFIGTPYLWGGRTRIGIDCSGLVQASLQAAGIASPRDSDMQQAELGTAIEVNSDFDGLARGDLVFWPGHVGIMANGVMLVHANAHHMAVVVEPLPEAAQRIAKAGAEVSSIRRFIAAA